MNQRRHRFTAFLLAVAMLSVLIFQSFAFFTDRETIQVSGTAGTVQIGLDTAKIKLMDEKGKDILNPGDKRDFSYTVKSLGNKSIDVKETIILSAFDSTNKPLDLSPTQSEFELYNSTDVELIAGAGWFPIATKEPIVIKTLSKNTIKYVRPEYVLSGGARYQDTEREIEYNNAVPIGTEATSNLVLLFKAASTNKWQKAILKFDIVVEAKQHRNTSAGWEAMIKDEVILGNGDKLPTIPDKEPNVPSVVIKPGDTPPVDVPPETPDFTWEDNPNGGITITGLTGTGVKNAQDNGQVEIPDTIGGKPVTDVNLGNIKDTITDGTTGNIDIVIPPGVADSIVGNGGNGSEMVVEKLQDKIWTYDKITEKDVSTATITGLTTYGQTAKKLVTPKSLGGVPVNKIQGIQSTNLNTMLITDNITSIGDYAFRGCTNMSGTLNIPASVVSIDTNFLSGTKISTVNLDTTDKLQFVATNSISIPRPFTGSNATTINYTNKALTKLPAYAFSGAGKMTSYSYPASVTEIGKYAFSECTSLTKINDLTGITRIGNSAFQGCTSLTTAPVIPNTV
ncbi:MAG: leucine-rich repeat domain-containing protein, partial [Oscillospiraceae bacterium]